MAGKSLRSQLNQIRAWVREGRTDAWIAHQLEVSGLRAPRLPPSQRPEADPSPTPPTIFVMRSRPRSRPRRSPPPRRADDEEEDDDDEDRRSTRTATPTRTPGTTANAPAAAAAGAVAAAAAAAARPSRASFDHGEKDGYGLWLDPKIKDNPVYAEHWAGHRPVHVSIEADQIVIRRAD